MSKEQTIKFLIAVLFGLAVVVFVGMNIARTNYIVENCQPNHQLQVCEFENHE